MAAHLYCSPPVTEAERTRFLIAAAKEAPVGSATVPVWDGSGHPNLLHLTYAAHLALPYMVAALLKSIGREKLMLVGACAWQAHTRYPLNTEDVDLCAYVFVALSAEAILVRSMLSHFKW
jgi:hypothetical protein